MADLTYTPELIGVVHQRDAEIYDLKLAADVDAGQALEINANGKGILSATKFRGIALKTKKNGNTTSILKKGTLYGYDLSGLAYDAPVYLSATEGALADAGTVVVGRVFPLTDDNVLTKVLWIYGDVE